MKDNSLKDTALPAATAPVPVGENHAWFTPVEIAMMLGCTMDEFWEMAYAGRFPLPELMNDTLEIGWYSSRH